MLLMILAVGFFAVALGSGHRFTATDTSQLKTYGFIVLFVVSYFFLRMIRIKKDRNTYSNRLHWFTFGLLFVSCFGLVEIISDIMVVQTVVSYFLVSTLLIGILNGLFLCCVFLSRKRV